MINTAIVFDHRGRTPKGKPGPIEIRVTVSRKPYYINTGVRVIEKNFKFGSVINLANANELNERIRIVATKVEKEINYCIEKSLPVDVREIRRKVFDADSSSQYEVAEWMKERISLLTVSQGTRSHYTTMLMRFIDYGEMRRWADVTVDAIYRWDAWLHNLEKPLTKAQKLMGMKPEKLSDAGVYNYHKALKRLLRLASKAKLIPQNPYSDLYGEFDRGEHENVEYLTEEEMKAVMEVELQRGSHLDMCRDLFVVQMFTGMAYADISKFDISDYKKINGVWRTNEERVKSGVAFVARLLPPVVEVLEKYGWKLPQITNQAYNRALKKIGKRAGLTTSLHTHLARHTFGTYMLGNDVNLENLQRMMGHKDIKMTQRYAKTLAKSVHNEFDKIEAKLKK